MSLYLSFQSVVRLLPFTHFRDARVVLDILLTTVWLGLSAACANVRLVADSFQSKSALDRLETTSLLLLLRILRRRSSAFLTMPTLDYALFSPTVHKYRGCGFPPPLFRTSAVPTLALDCSPVPMLTKPTSALVLGFRIRCSSPVVVIFLS